MLVAAVLFASSALVPCYAQVHVPTVNLGLTNFEDGFATPGWFLQEFPDYYHADQLKDSQGNAVPGCGVGMTYLPVPGVGTYHGSPSANAI